MKKLVFSLSALLIGGYVSAQQVHPCGTDMYNKELLENNASVQQAKVRFDNGLAEFMKSYSASNYVTRKTGLGKASAPKYIIPVVVHIFHSNGAENISDAQVQSEIDFMNKSFRKLNSDTGNVRPIFKDIAADAQIEFRLARKDPQGNCTNGIVRYYTTLTDKGNDELKEKSVWDTKSYLNMWIVKRINKGPGVSVAGYAQFPFFSGGEFSAKTDGVMMINNEFGNIPGGTSLPGQTPNVTTTTHEVGHWLGLYHPFQGDSCGSEGDGIQETPTTYFIATTQEPLRNRCNNPTFNSCATDNPDLPDMQENYMDYFIGNCASNMFTAQQVARMHFVLENYRRQLWQPSNLAKTGALITTSTCAPIPSFSLSFGTGTRICLGANTALKDNSYNGDVTGWAWSFGDGAEPATSNVKNPTVKWNTPGWKTITLTVSNANGSNTKEFTNRFYVESQSEVKGLGDGFQCPDWDYQNDFLQKGWYFENETDAAKWVRTSAAAYTGEYSLMLDRNSTSYGFSYSIVSPTFNFSGAVNPKISFNYSFAQNFTGSTATDVSADEMVLWVSTDCGATWLERLKLTPTLLNTNFTAVSGGTNSIPSNLSQWKLGKIEGSQIANDFTSIKFKLTFTNAGGNNLYIDNLCFGTTNVGMEENLSASDFNFNIYPNPTASSANISFETTKAEHVTVNVLDITGKVVATLADATREAGKQSLMVDRSALSLGSGLYFVNVKIGPATFTQKLILN